MAPANKIISKNYQAKINAKKFVEKQNQKVRKQYFKSQRRSNTNNVGLATSSNNFKPQQTFRTIHGQEDSSNNSKERNGFKKPSKFQNALKEMKQKKLEAQKKTEDIKKRKEEMNDALKKYKEKKCKKMKLLSKKTKKGQPIMKYWIEDMLEKIQAGME